MVQLSEWHVVVDGNVRLWLSEWWMAVDRTVKVELSEMAHSRQW